MASYSCPIFTEDALMLLDPITMVEFEADSPLGWLLLRYCTSASSTVLCTGSRYFWSSSLVSVRCILSIFLANRRSSVSSRRQVILLRILQPL